MQAPEKFLVALVQMSLAPDPEGNLQRALSRVEEAARNGAKLICLPELFRSLYFCQEEDVDWFDLAEPVPGPTTEAMGTMARKMGVVVITPVFERRASGLYHNSLVVIDADGEMLGLYRKMHVPDDPAYYEKFYFTPGDLGFQAFSTRVGRIGALICWDQWYPEAARLVTLQGASALFFPTAIGWHPQEKEAVRSVQLDAWRTVQRGHAIANGIYVAAVNRVGHELLGTGPGINFWGSSFICDPLGIIVAEASTEKEEILYAEVDLERIEAVRRNWPFLRDRRPDAYRGVDCRYLDDAPQNKRS